LIEKNDKWRGLKSKAKAYDEDVYYEKFDKKNEKYLNKVKEFRKLDDQQ
jgi:PAB1-binding protein PBP1